MMKKIKDGRVHTMTQSSLKDKIFEIMEKNQFAVMATINEEGKPWARYIACKSDKDLTIRFATFLDSRKVKQIKADPEVHFTMGVNNLEHMGAYLQIQGKAEVSSDAELKKSFWSEGLKYYFKGEDDPNYVVVTVKPYLIEYWHMASEPEVLKL